MTGDADTHGQEHSGGGSRTDGGDDVATNSDGRPRLNPFDRVHDCESDSGILVVVEHLKTPLEEYDIIPGVTAADLNRQYGYPPDDETVIAAYQRMLESHFGDEWRTWDAAELTDRLLYARPRGDLVPRIHALARSRVVRYDAGNYTELPSGEIRCNTCLNTFPAIGVWIEHAVTDGCDSSDDVPNAEFANTDHDH